MGGCILASAGFGDCRLVVATSTSRTKQSFDLLLKAKKNKKGRVGLVFSPLEKLHCQNKDDQSYYPNHREVHHCAHVVLVDHDVV